MSAQFGAVLSRAMLVLLICLTSASLFVGPAWASPLPVRWDILSAIGPGLFPSSPPPGANVPCKPSRAHPNPVVMVIGTGVNQQWVFQAGAPFLKNNGYCVYTFNYGNPDWLPTVPTQAVADINDSAREVQRTVRRVLRETGAKKVDLVGHSQGGGITSAYYINLLGGHRYVDKLIGISPSNHGTSGSTVGMLQPAFGPVGASVWRVLNALAPGFHQQFIDADMVKKVFANGDTRPGVHYTTIVTIYDQIVTPYTNQYLRGPNVTNITLQDGCPVDWSEHASVLYSERTWHFVRNALDPAHAPPVECTRVAPYFGSQPQPWAYDLNGIRPLT